MGKADFDVMQPFDSFIAIDWSGAKALQTPALAVAKIESLSNNVRLVCPPRDLTHWSRQSIADYIEGLLRDDSGRRMLIGIDSNFGYAAPVIRRQLPDARNAFDLWSLVEHTCQKVPNFYAGNFWQHIDFKSYFWTEGKMPAAFSMPRRLTEQACYDQIKSLPESPFKMIGAKQVGKGGLAAMRMAHFFRQRNKPEDIAFWPFDNAPKCAAARIVIAECYPRIYIRKAVAGHTKIRDISSLNKALAAFSCRPYDHLGFNDHQSDALIAAAGIKHLIQGAENKYLDISGLPSDIFLEGWILGVEPQIPSIESA